MNIQNVAVKTDQGIKNYKCILKNKEQSIYKIVNSEGEANPQSLEWKHNGHLQLLIFNGLKIVNADVFSFTSLTKESYRLGTLME